MSITVATAFLSILCATLLWCNWRILGLLTGLPIVAVLVGHYYYALPKTRDAQVAKFLTDFHVVGHRGCSADAPENTVPAFQLAYEHGAQGVEFDLEFTKDDVPIILHDDTVDRTTDGTGRIADLTWEQVKKMNAAAKFRDTKGNSHYNTSIPTLDETVKFCVEKKLKIIFDVKAPDRRAIDALAKVFKQYTWLYDNSAVCSFFPWIAYQMKSADPRVITGHTWRPWVMTYLDVENTKPRATGIRHFANQLVDMFNVWAIHSWLPHLTAADIVLTQRKEISASYVAMQEERGMRVMAWTVNDPREQLYFRETLNITYLTDITSLTPLVDKGSKLFSA